MLDVTFRYAIATVTHLDGQSFSAVRASYYSYGVLDGEEREILAYQWHPDGPSPVRFPHLHATAAPAILLAERAAPRSEPRSVALGRMHLRTGPVILEDVVELLITEFDVAPRRRDRSDVLSENRSLRQDERHD